jgi:hypothetical protein
MVGRDHSRPFHTQVGQVRENTSFGQFCEATYEVVRDSLYVDVSIQEENMPFLCYLKNLRRHLTPKTSFAIILIVEVFRN